MPLKKVADVAQYQNGDWSHHLETVPGMTVASARRRAIMNPDITYFFFCQQAVYLGKQGKFQAGDAVFFSGEPQWGEASQCDGYVKEQLTTAYVDMNSSKGTLTPVGCFTLADGSPAFDIVSIFAGNINRMSGDYIDLNPNVAQGLNKTYIQQLQEQGIVVLLTILGNHTDAGWSNFTSWSNAQAYAKYLGNTFITPYGLDGIDIDDEYSQGTPNATSLAMVTTAMRREPTLDGTLITIASYFYNNNAQSPELQQDGAWTNEFTIPSTSEKGTLAGNVDYVWDMAYQASFSPKMSRYAAYGIANNRLFCGVDASYNTPSDAASNAADVISGGYGGMMIYVISNSASQALAKSFVDALYGTGQWQVTAGCLPQSWQQ